MRMLLKHESRSDEIINNFVEQMSEAERWLKFYNILFDLQLFYNILIDCKSIFYFAPFLLQKKRKAPFYLKSSSVIYLWPSWRRGNPVHLETRRLCLGFPLGAMKYLTFSFRQHAMPSEFGGKWGTEVS